MNFNEVTHAIKVFELKIPNQVSKKLFATDKLKTVYDLFCLNIDSILESGTISMNEANNYLDEIDRIKSSKIMDYQIFDSIIDIRSFNGFSEIFKQYPYTDFINDKNSLSNVNIREDVSETFQKNYDVLLRLDDLLNITMSFNDKKQLRGTGNTKTICFTGKGFLSRPKLSILANQLGYEAVSTVIKDLDVLVCEDPFVGTVKLEKAAQNGTKIMSYDEFQLRVEQKFNPDEILKFINLDF